MWKPEHRRAAVRHGLRYPSAVVHPIALLTQLSTVFGHRHQLCTANRVWQLGIELELLPWSQDELRGDSIS
jgi:hypothetical protein